MKVYRISIPEGDNASLKDKVLGYKGEHTVELKEDSFVYFYNSNTKDLNASKTEILEKLKQDILNKKDVIQLTEQASKYSSIADSIPYALCLYTTMVKELMPILAPDSKYSFTYKLFTETKQNDDPAYNLWNCDFILEIGPDFNNDFNLDVENIGVFPISLEEKVEDKLEKIPKDSDQQRKKTTIGSD